MYCIRTMNDTILTYNEMYAKFQAGQITEQAWREFCAEQFDRILSANREVFERLKFR